MTQDASLSMHAMQNTSLEQLELALAQVASANRQSPAQLRQSLASQVFELALRDLDPALQPLLPQLQTLLGDWLREQDEAYLDPTHPLRHLFDRTYRHLSHWYPRDAKPSQQFYERFSQALGSPSDLESFCDWADKEAERADMLARRLGESETGHLRQQSIESQVVALLNEQLAERLLPQEVQQSLPLLKSELQHSLTTEEGAQAPLWRHWLRLLPHISKAFNEPDDQWLYSQVPALISELERSLQLPQSHPAGYQFFIDQLSQALLTAVQKKDQSCSPLPPLDYPEGYQLRGARVSQTLLQQSQALQVGDWLIFNSEHEARRARLACKINEAEQLLFVDQAGRKLMSQSLKDMALCLTTGLAMPLPEPRLHSLLGSLQNKLHSQAQQLLQRQQAEEHQARAAQQAQHQAQQLAKQKQAEEQARQQAEQQLLQEQLELRRAAARKAMAEAQALASSHKQQADAHKQQASLAHNANQAEELLSSLRVGAWLDLQLTPGAAQRAKLSVILSSAGKYIFVDQLGRKLAELQRSQLLELIAQERALLIRQGGDFEDQLAKVIRGLRKDISL